MISEVGVVPFSLVGVFTLMVTKERHALNDSKPHRCNHLLTGALSDSRQILSAVLIH